MTDIKDLYSRVWCCLLPPPRASYYLCNSSDPHETYGCRFRWAGRVLDDDEAEKHGLKVPPPFKVGDNIRFTKIINGTRLGRDEPKKVKAITTKWFVYETYSAKGEWLNEEVVPLVDACEAFEVVTSKGWAE